jgi:hypothetical protein
MRRAAPIFLAVVLALLVRPLQLPASCILSNAPSYEACKPKCCANKTCCAVSKKHTGPISPPLLKSSDASQQLLIGFVPISTIDSVADTAFAQTASIHILVRAHSLPPLAASCIRLI